MLGAARGWFHENSVPLRVFFSSRLALFLFAYLSLMLIPMAQGSGLWRAFPGNLFLDGWVRWDSGWYGDIATRGYTDVATAAGERDTAFFPLYPLAVRAVAFLTRNPYAAGFIVANVALLGSVVLLFRLARKLTDGESARRATWLLVAFPFSFYLSAMYSECLFLFTALAAFYLAERGRWAWAGAFCALCGLSRIAGFLTTPALAMLYVERRRQARQPLAPEVLWLGLGALGPLAFMAYLWARFGDPLEFVRAQGGWSVHGGLAPALAALKTLLSPHAIAAGQVPAMELLQLAALGAGLALSVAAFRALPAAYGFWSLSTLLLSSLRWHSSGRFVAVVFPCFIVAARLLRDEGAFLLALQASALLLALLTIVFTHWYWIL